LNVCGAAPTPPSSKAWEPTNSWVFCAVNTGAVADKLQKNGLEIDHLSRRQGRCAFCAGA
jgi:ferredoxin